MKFSASLVGLPRISLLGVLRISSLLCSWNQVAIIVTFTSSSYDSSNVIHHIIFTSLSIISSTTDAASFTSTGVRSCHHVTANIIFFALSKLVSSNGFSIAFLAASIALFSQAPYHIHNNAFHEFCITTFMSAKSILISHGFMIRSDIHCTHKNNILSIIINACLNDVFLSITVNILSFGITIRVSTLSFNFFSHSSAFNSLFLPSNENGFVTIATVSIHILFAILATTGHAHDHVHHPNPSVIKTMSVSCKIAFISASDSSAAFLHISGLAHAQSHLVKFNHILTFSVAKHVARS